jgi:hypothetical protein
LRGAGGETPLVYSPPLKSLSWLSLITVKVLNSQLLKVFSLRTDTYGKEKRFNLNTQSFILTSGIFLAALSLGCSDSEFTSQLDNSKSKKSDDSSDDNTKGKSSNDFDEDGNPIEGDLDFDESKSSESDGDENLIFDEDEIAKIKSKCWFAVSGAFIGEAGYQMNFPDPIDNGPIEHGAKFDTSGGVFLEAREEPYEYGQAGKEIDLAAETTFDSFIIAPDMHAIIKDGNGNIIFEGDGPIVGFASIHSQGAFRNAVGSYAKWPEWIKEIIDNNQTKSVNLHSGGFGTPKVGSAQWVSVKPIKGNNCDVKFGEK